MLMILQVLNLQISNKPRKDKHKMDEQKTILDHKSKSISDRDSIVWTLFKNHTPTDVVLMRLKIVS